MLYWTMNEDGDLMPRPTPLPVAATRDVRGGVAHLDGVGALALPAAATVLAGVAYGADGEFVGTFVPENGVAPPDPAHGWGRLRALLRARLEPLRAWTGDARGLVAAGVAEPRALPSGEYDVSAEAGSRAEAGFFEAGLRLVFYARASGDLDRLSHGAVALLTGWRLEDETWAARGFRLVAQEDGARAADVDGGPNMLMRSLRFAFRAWRTEPDDDDSTPEIGQD